MANFLSLETTPPTYPVSGVGLGGRTTHWARGTYTITAALALNDTIQLFDMPRNARVLYGGFIKSDDLDSGGTAIRVNVGDAVTLTVSSRPLPLLVRAVLMRRWRRLVL